MLRPIDDKCKILIYDESWSGDQLQSNYRVVPFDWDKMISFAQQPYIADTLDGYDPNLDPKDNRKCIPLWAFYTPKDQIVKLRPNGKPSGCIDNMYVMHTLQIDFDDGIKMDDVIDKWKDYTYLCFTTPSHSLEKDKFRLIVPLDCGYVADIFRFREIKQEMLNMVEGCDKSTFDSFRKQRMPGKMHIDSPYRYEVNTGKLYNIPEYICDMYDELSEAEEEEKNKPLVKYGGNKSNSNIFTMPIEDINKSEDAILDYVDSVLSNLDFNFKGGGVVNAALLRCNSFMEHAGLSSYERRIVLYGYTNDRERRSSIDRMVKN
jgi:hypothetical protein